MELVVVLSILATLAAIVIPMLPNLLRRAHKATDAAQTSEISKAVQLYQGLYTSYPDEFDLLTDGTAFPSYVPADGGKVFGGFATPGKLDPKEVAALASVGISNVHTQATTLAAIPPQPTLDPYEAPYATTKKPIDTTLNFAILDPNTNTDIPANFLATVRAANTVGTTQPRFVVFGVGARSTMVGKVIQDAPTSVPQNKDFTPATLYSRFGVIFMVSGEEVTRTERARFIAAVALEDDELELTEKDIVGYYQVAR
jgi:type II secretory pathway pseudopilin PulG